MHFVFARRTMAWSKDVECYWCLHIPISFTFASSSIWSSHICCHCGIIAGRPKKNAVRTILGICSSGECCFDGHLLHLADCCIDRMTFWDLNFSLNRISHLFVAPFHGGNLGSTGRNPLASPVLQTWYWKSTSLLPRHGQRMLLYHNLDCQQVLKSTRRAVLLAFLLPGSCPFWSSPLRQKMSWCRIYRRNRFGLDIIAVNGNEADNLATCLINSVELEMEESNVHTQSRSVLSSRLFLPNWALFNMIMWCAFSKVQLLTTWRPILVSTQWRIQCFNLLPLLSIKAWGSVYFPPGSYDAWRSCINLPHKMTLISTSHDTPFSDKVLSQEDYDNLNSKTRMTTQIG